MDGGAERQGTSVTIKEEGAHTIAYWSADKAGNVESKHQAVVRIDKTAPVLTVATDQRVLWPPNHQLITETADVKAADSLSGIASIVLTSITSSEPDGGSDSGDMPNDIQGAQFGTGDTQFMLRAERAGDGDGRSYTVTYAAADNAGNRTTASATVKVPHSQSGK